MTLGTVGADLQVGPPSDVRRQTAIGLSIVIPVLDDRSDYLARVADEACRAAGALGAEFEVILVAPSPPASTAAVVPAFRLRVKLRRTAVALPPSAAATTSGAAAFGEPRRSAQREGGAEAVRRAVGEDAARHRDRVRIVYAPWPGYGSALCAAFAAARGSYVLTLDADLSHPSTVIERLWNARDEAEVIIASRYVPSASADMPLLRRVFSRALNVVFSRGLSLGVRDMSSGCRLYDARVLKQLAPTGRGLNVLQEILVKAHAEGWRVREVPFDYRPLAPRIDFGRIVRFGLDYLRTFVALWKLRNSIASADYDDRAHDSAIPLQRYWQRERFRHITELAAGHGRVLDVGCGSSRILGALPRGSIGLDLLARKLRYARKFGRPLIRGSALALPFPDVAFPCVVCSQVIEHIPADNPSVLDELDRVLAPGGRLVLGTPDYSRWEWRVTEALYKRAAPNAYADEHVTHYTRAGLIEHFTRRGYAHEATRYILRGELILAFRKGQHL